MKKQTSWLEYREKMRKILKEKTGCTIQHDGWTCGSCFYSLSERLNNKDWQTILLLRGDHSPEELDNLPKKLTSRIERIIKLIK